jgi:hypothetical protein
MFGQRLANPHILAILGADKQNEVVSGRIVGVKEICDYAQEAEAARKQDELILFAQLCEDVLLELL